MAKEIRKLKANEIECRVGKASAEGFSLLLYKDARVDMNILDETFGNMNWQREHKEIKGNLYCGISIWDEEKQQWITKWDCGIESKENDGNEKKGESSDSFKRACFNVGIGRELYSSPFIWVRGNVKEVERNGRKSYVPVFKEIDVKSISYNEDGEIDSLIINGDDKVVFRFDETKENLQEDIGEPITDQQIAKMRELGVNEANVLKKYKVDNITKLTYQQAEFVISTKQRALGEK